MVMNWKGFGKDLAGSDYGLILRYSPSIRLETLRIFVVLTAE
jgi:hypothetical protein